MMKGIKMKKILHIRRQEGPNTAPYWEDFLFESEDESATVATALSRVSEKNRTSEGRDRAFRPLMWEHSCLQKKCGACAMVIDGSPRLACDTPLRETKRETVFIEPLRKFPVIEDLLVDRTSMMDELKNLSVWFEGDAGTGTEDMTFEAPKCLQCGLCLEVCPNFAVGGRFGGMAAMSPLARLISRLPKDQRRQIARNYTASVYEGCGKSLACRDVCPAGVDIENLMVKSNAAAVWKRWNKV